MAAASLILALISLQIALVVFGQHICTKELRRNHKKSEDAQQQMLEELRQIKALLTKDE